MSQFNSFLAITEVYFNEGNEAYRKKDYSNAVYFYTEGIEVNCKDEDLKAKLYSNRALAHHKLGETIFIYKIEWAEQPSGQHLVLEILSSRICAPLHLLVLFPANFKFTDCSTVLVRYNLSATCQLGLSIKFFNLEYIFGFLNERRTFFRTFSFFINSYY